MNIRIKTSRATMTPAIQKYLDGRVASIEKLLGGRADSVRLEVELGVAAGGKQHSDYMWYAELHLMAPGERPLYARNHAATVNAAIDDVKEEMERQIRKEKRATATKRRKGGREVKRVLKGE